MNRRQIARYLDKLQRQRPEFLEFLSKEAERTTKSQTISHHHVARSAYEESAMGSAEMVRRRFLQKQSHAIYEAPDSRAIEQRPHRNGGLSYAYTSQLTHFFTTKEEPGRMLDMESPEHYNPRASFAGMAVNVRQPISPSEVGPKLRVVESVLKEAPRVVSAQPRGLDDATIHSTVVDTANLEMMRANPFRPGSRAYIAHAQTIAPPTKGKRGMTHSKPQPQTETDLEKAKVSEELLNTLRNIIHTMPSVGNKKDS